MNSPTLYCRTHDSYYRPPRCSPLCTLLASWSEPVRDMEARSRQALQRESAELCQEASRRYGGGRT